MRSRLEVRDVDRRWRGFVPGPSSIDDHASDTCVGPTSVTVTVGFVGGVVSGGVVKLTELLFFE
jgi:hypothetical protein